MRIHFRSGIIGLAGFALVGLAACGASDSTSSAGPELTAEQPVAEQPVGVVASEGQEEPVILTPENSGGLLLGEDAGNPVSDAAPLTTTPELPDMQTTTTFSDNFAIDAEMAPTTTAAPAPETFVIYVDGSDPVPETTAPVPETTTTVKKEAESDGLTFSSRLSDCPSVKMGALSDPVSNPANHEKFREFYDNAFRACLLRPMFLEGTSDAAVLVKNGKRVEHTWVQELITIANQGATNADVEAAATKKLQTIIIPSREHHCVRSLYDCAPKLDLQDSQGKELVVNCDFGTKKVVEPSDNARTRIISMCTNINEFSILPPPAPAPASPAPASPAPASPAPASPAPASPAPAPAPGGNTPDAPTLGGGFTTTTPTTRNPLSFGEESTTSKPFRFYEHTTPPPTYSGHSYHRETS